MKKLSQEDIASVYNRCLSLVRRKPCEFLIFKKLRCCGYCDYDKDVLEIDYRKDMLSTAYHECIHYIFPEWSETRVRYAESRVVNQVSLLDNARFLKHISMKMYKYALEQEKKLKRNKNET